MKGFYLAGGTALALQLGHRRSIDLDFFSDVFPKRDLLIQGMEQYEPQITNEAPGTIDMLVSDVKVSFLEYNYPLLENLVDFDGIKLASIIDISCMKLSAISSRGSKKDFIDLYVILKKYTLEELFEKFEKKFVGVSYQKLIILKSLIYFDDADKEPDPDFTDELTWDEVKKNIESKVKEYLQKETLWKKYQECYWVLHLFYVFLGKSKSNEKNAKSVITSDEISGSVKNPNFGIIIESDETIIT